MEEFSLLRGSGLKSFWNILCYNLVTVLPLAREWIEISSSQAASCTIIVLPLAREWIEIIGFEIDTCYHEVLPLAREWIEISRRSRNSRNTRRSPSCEGVD